MALITRYVWDIDGDAGRHVVSAPFNSAAEALADAAKNALLQDGDQLTIWPAPTCDWCDSVLAPSTVDCAACESLREPAWLPGELTP